MIWSLSLYLLSIALNQFPISVILSTFQEVIFEVIQMSSLLNHLITLVIIDTLYFSALRASYL